MQIKTHFLLFLLALSAVLPPVPALAQDSGNGDSAFTLWGVVFNEPEDCSGGICDDDDVFSDPVSPMTAVLFLAGQRVQSNGRLAFGASLPEGATLGALPFPADSLFDADAAEVHLILRTHGDYLPGIADEQISSFGGGCEVQACEDLQFAVFRPQDVGPDGSQTTVVRRFSDGSAVAGAWATIQRETDGVVVTLHSRLD